MFVVAEGAGYNNISSNRYMEGGEVRLIGGGGMQWKGREIMGLLIYDRGIVKYQLWKLASLFSDNQDV